MTTGTLYVSGEVVDPMQHAFQSQIAYVADVDVLEPTATCNEILSFSQNLRGSQNKVNTTHILRDLKLEKCVHTQARHLSAGERRRLSIAVELVAQPKILILDEPTSGL